MRAFAWVAFVVLGSAATVAAGADDDPQPLAVISTSPVEELAAHYRYLAALPHSDLQALADLFLMATTGGKGLGGLDKTRPLGAAIWVKPSENFPFPWEPEILSFLPVADFARLVDSLSAGSVVVRQGALELSAFPVPVFFKEQHGWALVSSSFELLQSPPADPLVLLGALPTKYDLGARVFAARLPQDMRLQWERAITPLAEDVRRRANEDADALARRRQLARERLAVLRRLVDDLDEVELGVQVDAARRTISGDLLVTCRQGSETARWSAAARRRTETRFGGFVRPDACAAFHFSSGFAGDPLIQAIAQVAIFHWSSEQIDPVIGELFTQLGQTVQEGGANAGLSLLGEGPFTLILGIRVVLAQRFGELVHEVFREAGRQGQFGDVQFQPDVGRHGPVQLSTIRVSLPEGARAWTDERLFGSRDVEIVIGIDQGRESVYLAVGNGGLQRLREAIDRSQDVAAAPPPPVLVSFRLSPLAALAADLDPGDPRLAAIRSNLLPGQDRIATWADHVENGYHVRLEVEEGVVRTLMIGMQRAGTSPPGPATPSTARARPTPPELEKRAQGYLKIGELFERRGDMDVAIKWYGKAAELKGAGDPGLEAQERLDRLQERAGDTRRP